jgi:hypothetical protein
MPRARLTSKRRLLLYVAGVLLVALVLAQLLLPHFAAERIESRIARYGEVHSVSVSAWPAVELLWGDADSVRVKTGELAIPAGKVGSLLHEASGIASLTVGATAVRLGALRATDATLQKRGTGLRAQALASAADVQAALPPGVNLQLLGSHAGEVEVRASGALFGVSASLDAVASPSSGKIVVRPVGFLLGALGLTLYADPHVYVLGLGASVQSANPTTYRLTIAARLR